MQSNPMGKGFMVGYRLYSLDGAGRCHEAEAFEADDDLQAIRKARQLNPHALKCEVWRGNRLIGTLTADDLRDPSWDVDRDFSNSP